MQTPLFLQMQAQAQMQAMAKAPVITGSSTSSSRTGGGLIRSREYNESKQLDVQLVGASLRREKLLQQALAPGK